MHGPKTDVHVNGHFINSHPSIIQNYGTDSVAMCKVHLQPTKIHHCTLLFFGAYNKAAQLTPTQQNT
jgi:hypothetical protein